MFKTKLSQSYPVEMTLALARLMREALDMHEVALEEGRSVPVARHEDDGGLPSLTGCLLAESGWTPLELKLARGPCWFG